MRALKLLHIRWLVALTLVVGPAVAIADVGPSRERNIRFGRVSLEQGLSQSAVNCIFQDGRGFMWFGTEDGLNRYDGHTFTVFKNDPEDPTSLAHNFVWSILEDRNGVLWVGTDGGGLSRLDRSQRSFTHFMNDPDDPGSLAHDRVRVVFEDRDGVLWVGTDGGGLNRFDAETGTFKRFLNDPVEPDSLAHDRVRTVYQGRDGALWIGTYGGGLDRLDPDSATFTHYRHDPDDPGSLSGDRIYSTYEDRDGALWVGTYGSGLNRLDPGSGEFTRFRHDPDDPDSLAADRVRALYQDGAGVLWIGTDGGLHEMRRDGRGFARYRNDPADPQSLSNNKVMALYRDRGGVLWVGTKAGGLNKWNATTGSFTHFKKDPSAPSTLSSPAVTSIREDIDGILWLGTFGGGLNRLDRTTGTYTHYRHDPGNPSGIADDRVMSLAIDRDGVLWLGTYEAGLERFDPATGVFTHFPSDPDDPTRLSRSGVMSLLEDRNGVLWVGTYEGGLNRFDRESGKFTRYLHDAADARSLSNNRVTSLHEDARGDLWVGTDGGGLNRFDRERGTFTRFLHEDGNIESLSSDVVWSIHEDARGALWIGTQGGGINRWEAGDRAGGRPVFRRYLERDGLPNAFVYGILSDENGRIWMSTNKGLARLDPRTSLVRTFDTTHGLQSNEFNFGAYYRSPGGEMFFGGINGLNAFFPEAIRENAHAPPVLLTNFLKFNQRVQLDRPLSETDEIVLKYSDYVVSFEFAALDFTAPEKNRYAYKLEGFDEDWIELDNMRRATYTNLDAGEYVLKVKAANNDGVWNEQGATLPVRVLPPPWQTWWAYTLYLLALAGVVIAYTRGQARKLEREAEYSRKLEDEVRSRTRELADRNQELQVVNRMLEEASLTDSLTGLRNRRYLMTEIDKDIALTERYYEDTDRRGRQGPPPPGFLFLMIDLDGLKKINDVYGHMAGDMALLQMRDILQKVCRRTDTIIRWGGDEFLIVGRSLDMESAERLAQRIRDTVAAHPFSLGIGEEAELSCSVGFAKYPFLPNAPTVISWEQVVTIADRALYIAKTSGRNAWVAIFGNERTPPEDLVHLINEQPETLFEEGALELRTSIPDRERLVWERA